MRATTEQVLRRVRGVIGTRGNEQSNAAIARLALHAVLFGTLPVPAWRNEAACATEPAELFYPDAADHAGVAEAKHICAGCPVRADCLLDVLGWENPSRRHGIVGGLTPNGRDHLVAAQRRTAGREVAA